MPFITFLFFMTLTIAIYINYYSYLNIIPSFDIDIKLLL